MRMYPAYKLEDVLNEYAVAFFTLLNEGYRLQNHEWMMAGYVARNANAPKGADFDKLQQQLKWASQHPSDILNLDDDGSSPEQLKKVLGGGR